MSVPKIHYSVVLTQEARELLKDDIIFTYLHEGTYFNCIEIDPNGNYFFMKVEKKFRNKNFTTEISIPHRFVLYVVSADSSKSPGF
jgi:protein associated with RNAse G/E